MGLFDSLKKIGEDISKEVEKNVGTETFNNIKKAMANAANDSNTNSNSGIKENRPKEIPAEYAEFPRFRENNSGIETKETEKYIRCKISYDNVSLEEVNEYISKIVSQGYARMSYVRFEKNNTYIIVEYLFESLNLVYHIKR